jgi:pimeloyl-ACP methyl ester carboxylesterase
MPRATSNGIELEYETFGDRSDPALLLVMGFTAQMTLWDAGFCQALADHGHFVIRFDNRDCGLSTKLEGVHVDLAPILAAAAAGHRPGDDVAVPYRLTDMATDAVGLLDALDIERAHVVGASMGGMIAQTMAIEHPERVATLTSVMSTTGEAKVGQASPEAMAALTTPPPVEREAYIANSVAMVKTFSSKRYYDPDKQAGIAAAAYDRSFYPQGAPRQLAAIIASGNRVEGLAALDTPTLVVHGYDDTLIAPSGGERTAELVAGSKLLMLKDMGHDLPDPIWPFVAATIAAHARR